MYYLATDLLGSITAIVPAGNGTIEYRSYDAWGRLRNPDDWTYNNVSAFSLIDRGYTFHEHLPEFGLINMNGRMYDPLVARFLSPDPYVQDPGSTQGFNRYSYCLNNPLKYTDPTGEFFWLIPVAIGVAVGAYQGYKIGQANGANGWSMAGYMIGGGVIGGVTGLVSAGVGVAVGGAVATAGIGGFVGGAITCGATGFTAGWINGYDMTTLAGGSKHDALNAAWKGALIGMGTGAILGGTIQGIYSSLQGNSFWTGKPIASPQPSITDTPKPINPTEVKPYNSRYHDNSELKVPEKLYHYTKENPSGWTELRPGKDGNIYLTTDGSLNRLNASINLDLPKVPGYRLEILTTDPNFNLQNIQMIRTVPGNVYGHGGGGWELLYQGAYQPSHVYQWTITPIY